jgi:hypothetical protein
MVANGCRGTASAVACDLAFSAAELSVQAQMLLQQQQTKSHPQRRDWIDAWVAHKNAPDAHARSSASFLHRSAARYADGGVAISGQRLGEILALVAEMIEIASAKAA